MAPHKTWLVVSAALGVAGRNGIFDLALHRAAREHEIGVAREARGHHKRAVDERLGHACRGGAETNPGEAKDPGLAAMLEAAMERRYSASPAERFFTGGGVHTFANFKREDNGKVPTVREALRDSVNLAFVRLMRDIVDHYMYRPPESPARVLEDAQHPRRAAYLARFADHEGREFVRRFYRKYRGMSSEQALDALKRTLQLALAEKTERLYVIRVITTFDEARAKADGGDKIKTQDDDEAELEKFVLSAGATVSPCSFRYGTFFFARCHGMLSTSRVTRRRNATSNR